MKFSLLLKLKRITTRSLSLWASKLQPGELLSIAIIWAVAAVVTGALLWLLSDVFWHGIGQISWEFLTTPPSNAGRDGGIAPIVVSTGLIVGVCMAVSIPLGVGTAVLLAEFSLNSSVLGRLVRLSLDVLAGVPSIVFGLFGNAFFCKTLGMGFSILSGGLTLACMVLPILIRSTQEGFRAVPDDYRRSAAALGISRTAMLWELLLPACHAWSSGGTAVRFGTSDRGDSSPYFYQRLRRPNARVNFGFGAIALCPYLRPCHECFWRGAACLRLCSSIGGFFGANQWSNIVASRAFPAIQNFCGMTKPITRKQDSASLTGNPPQCRQSG